MDIEGMRYQEDQSLLLLWPCRLTSDQLIELFQQLKENMYSLKWLASTSQSVTIFPPVLSL